jgi:uncharacterized membrane protein
VQVGLIALAAIPTGAGTLRLVEVFGGAHRMPDNPRIAASPSPAVLHIVGGLAFLLLGAFQFSVPARRRWPRWHRRAGRALVLLGLAAALAALWMTVFYARQTGTGQILHLLRLVFGTAMATSLVLGFRAIRRRDIAQHRAWMTRAYALGLGAGTQAITIGIGHSLFGKSALTTDLSTASGWLINIAVAELVIRRHRRSRRQARPASPADRLPGRLAQTPTGVRLTVRP